MNSISYQQLIYMINDIIQNKDMDIIFNVFQDKVNKRVYEIILLDKIYTICCYSRVILDPL